MRISPIERIYHMNNNLYNQSNKQNNEKKKDKKEESFSKILSSLTNKK